MYFLSLFTVSSLFYFLVFIFSILFFYVICVQCYVIFSLLFVLRRNSVVGGCSKLLFFFAFGERCEVGFKCEKNIVSCYAN